MPSPFSNNRHSQKGPGGQENDVVLITNSHLFCEICYDEVADGVYFPGQHRLIFECSNGHQNVVKDIEL